QVARIREPELARGWACGGDGRGPHHGWRCRERGNYPLRRDTRDPAGRADGRPGLRDPEIAVGPSRDAERAPAAPRQRGRGEVPGLWDAADLVARRLREPEVPVGAGGDVRWLAALPRLAESGPCGRRDRELRDLACRCDARDPVAAELRKPHVAIGPRRDGVRVRPWHGERKLGDLTGRRDTSDLVAIEFREPEISVRAQGDIAWLGIGGRDRKRGDEETVETTNDVARDFREPNAGRRSFRSVRDPIWL